MYSGRATTTTSPEPAIATPVPVKWLSNSQRQPAGAPGSVSSASRQVAPARVALLRAEGTHVCLACLSCSITWHREERTPLHFGTTAAKHAQPAARTCRSRQGSGSAPETPLQHRVPGAAPPAAVWGHLPHPTPAYQGRGQSQLSRSLSILWHRHLKQLRADRSIQLLHTAKAGEGSGAARCASNTDASSGQERSGPNWRPKH